MGFRISPLVARQAHIAQWTVYAVSCQFITWIDSWDLGCCLWTSGDQTMLGIELCMQFWVNSLQGSVHGIWGFALSEHPGSTQCLALNCVCRFRSIHYRDQLMGFGILPRVSGEQTLLSNVVCMHFHFNSWLDRFTGFGSRLWVSGEQTLLCMEVCTQFHVNLLG